jgi:hypothetical protein
MRLLIVIGFLVPGAGTGDLTAYVMIMQQLTYAGLLNMLVIVMFSICMGESNENHIAMMIVFSV